MAHPRLVLTPTFARIVRANVGGKTVPRSVAEDVLRVRPYMGGHVAVDISGPGMKPCDRLAALEPQMNHARSIHPRERFPRTGQRRPFVRNGECELARLKPLVVLAVGKKLTDVIAIE